MTALHKAAASSDTAELQQLLMESAAVDAFTEGRTTLRDAAESGRIKCVRLLFAHGAAADVRDAKGDTPLYWAAHWSYSDYARLLIVCVAPIDAHNADGRTPLYWAAERDSASHIAPRACGRRLGCSGADEQT